MKIYIHKQTGWVAKETKTNCELMIFRDDGSYVGSYPKILFENSNDWGLITRTKTTKRTWYINGFTKNMLLNECAGGGTVNMYKTKTEHCPYKIKILFKD